MQSAGRSTNFALSNWVLNADETLASLATTQLKPATFGQTTDR